MPSFYRPSGNGCADRVPMFGITFLRIATTNKPGAINPSIFCLFGFIFPKELLLWFVHHLYIGLSNDGRINDGRVVVRSVSVHSPANVASGARTDLRIQALPRLYRITPMPCIDIDFGARPYFFYYSLCIDYLLCNIFLIYHYYYYLRFALFFVHRKMIRGLRRHSAGLH